MRLTRTVFYVMSFFALALSSWSCESVSLVGRPSLPPEAGFEKNEIAGQIEGLDFNQKVIFVRTRQGGREIGYKPGTQILIDGRASSGVTSLRVGDSVAMHVRKDEHGQVYTDVVRVRSGPAGLSDFLEGRVEGVHPELGYLEIRPIRGELTRAYLPFNASPKAERTFHRLRIGEFVRIEGDSIGDARFQIATFL